MSPTAGAAPLLTQAERDLQAWQIINRHLSAAGLAPVPPLESTSLSLMVQPVLSAVFVDERQTTMMRQLFAALHQFYLDVLDPEDLRTTPETELQLFVSALVSMTTPASWERYRSFFPPTSEAQRRRDEAQNAEDERRRQDESSY